jgi:hypothetical protein
MSSERRGALEPISEHLGDLEPICALLEDATSAKPRGRPDGGEHLARRGVSARRDSPLSSE